MENNLNLINKIKSKYILKQIFRQLCEIKKLEFIQYNISLQKIFKVTIEDYKNIGGIYKIGKRNGKGKEYILNKDILIFEGQYFNGVKSGKGKEYYDINIIKFKGEYLYGKIIEGKGYDKKGNLILEIKKDGKRKEYYRNGEIKFEGEYYNGKRWNGKGYDNKGIEVFEIKRGRGFIKEYNYDGDVLFEGEYIDGKRNGKGKEYFNDGDIFLL